MYAYARTSVLDSVTTPMTDEIGSAPLRLALPRKQSDRLRDQLSTERSDNVTA
jgi:hypothetical protein